MYLHVTLHNIRCRNYMKTIVRVSAYRFFALLFLAIQRTPLLKRRRIILPDF